MKMLAWTLLLSTAVAAAGGSFAAEPRKGSHLPPDENACQMCHGEPDLWEKDKLQYLVSPEKLAGDLHYREGVNCHDCHGGDPSVFDPSSLHSADSGFRKLTDIWKACADCHPKAAASLAEGAHAEAGPLNEQGQPTPLACSKCHTDAVHGLLPPDDPKSPIFPANIAETCGACHKQAIAVIKGVHSKAGPRDAAGRGTPMSCGACHGENAHRMLPASNPDSPVFVDKQVKMCGECHEVDLGSYSRSVHGHGLFKAGLLVTAVCANCHRAHGIYRPPDLRSSLNPTNVAKTCGECHRFIEQRLERSIHGDGNGPGTLAERAAPGGKSKLKPSCTSCHEGHDIQDPELTAFRLQMSDRCGNCHADLSREYAMSMHGELTELGYLPAAKCSDCHGSHDILPISDARSPLSPKNRLATCRKCHPQADGNFAEFDPHADHTDPARDPILYAIYMALLTLIFSTFGFFGLHSILWLIRGTVEVTKHGRPRGLVPGEPAYVRFGTFHRTAHTIMLISFLGLALTGLPLKYSHYEWAKTLAFYLGGFESTSFWHRVFGLSTLICFVAYMIRMMNRMRTNHSKGDSWQHSVFGPDSPVPSFRDVRDFGRMVKWFFGLGPKPTFERWSYWEKFDFWGACADIVIIGFTGLVLWFPNLFCAFLPGITLNLAKVIHSTQALLATGFVFAIHFFNAHFRAEKFPADMSILTGLVSEEEMEEERPEFCERLRREGKLYRLQQKTPSQTRLWLLRAAGYVALLIGLALLAGMIVAGLGK